MAATIQVHRLAAPWRDRARKYKVLIDGEQVGLIANGAEESYQVDPGEHTIRIKIDWARSPDVTVSVAEGEIARLEAQPGPGGAFLAFFNSIFAPAKYVRLRVADDDAGESQTPGDPG